LVADICISIGGTQQTATYEVGTVMGPTGALLDV